MKEEINPIRFGILVNSCPLDTIFLNIHSMLNFLAFKRVVLKWPKYENHLGRTPTNFKTSIVKLTCIWGMKICVTISGKRLEDFM